MKTQKTFETWKEVVKANKATSFAREQEYNKNHLYAFAGEGYDTKLVGLWNMEKKEGVLYSKSMNFPIYKRGPKKRHLTFMDGI